MPNFQHLIHRLIHRSVRGGVMGYRSNSRAELRAETDFQRQGSQPKAPDYSYKLGESTRISRWRSWLLTRARLASDPDVRDRFTAIARHYRSLAKIEQSITDQRPNKRADNHASLQDVVGDHLTGSYRREAMRVTHQRESPSGLRSICDRQRSNP